MAASPQKLAEGVTEEGGQRESGNKEVGGGCRPGEGPGRAEPREQLEQLKAFKNQLLLELLTQLSPQPATHHHQTPSAESNLPHLSLPLSPTHLSTLSTSLPAATPVKPSSSGVSPSLLHPTLSLTPPQVSSTQQTPERASSRCSPQASLPQSLFPQSLSLSPNPKRSVGVSPAPSLPLSPAPRQTVPSWSAITSFETLSPPTHGVRKPPSPDLGLKVHQRERGSSPSSYAHISPVPHPAWVGGSEDTSSQLPSETRVALIEKHSRQVEDLKVYQSQLSAKCKDLEIKLQQSSMVNQALETQLERQKEYWMEWQTQADTYSHTISVLQDKLDACRTQLRQQDGMVEQLQADLQMSLGEIQFWKEQQSQEAGKFQQLCEEFEELQRKNVALETSQKSLRDELTLAQRERGRLEASAEASASQEQALKSTVQKLEDRVRHLEHVNNRLHGQATHYTLGSPYANSPDDGGNPWCRPRSASHALSHPHTSPLSTPPRSTLTPSHPHSPPTTTHHSQTSDGARSSPLNRRKWLQPSDPGLILGNPLPSHSSPPHKTGGHAHLQPSDATSSPLLQSTGQAITRQLSDSGSGNEGEDPTSLTRRSYINSRDSRKNREGGGGEECALVDSTLSAIQTGKIRADAAAGETLRKKVEKESVEERVRQSLRVVAEAEERLARLYREKEMLESMLQRTPRRGGGVTKHGKQAQLEMEERLEVVLKEIGSARMTLRSHHALHK